MCVCVYAMYVCVRKHLPLSMHFHMRTYAYICKYVNDTTLPMCRSPRQMDRRTGRHRLCTQTHRQKDTQKHAQRDKDRQRNTHTHIQGDTPNFSLEISWDLVMCLTKRVGRSRALGGGTKPCVLPSKPL